MEHTKNYHLPQWKKEDRIMMDDFNQMCRDIENGLDSISAEAKQAGQKAEALPYAVGTYTGDDTPRRTIATGFRPRFVIICDDQRATRDTASAMVLMAGTGQSSGGRLTMTDTGFLLDSSSTLNIYPRVNVSGRTYDYIAFR